MKAPEQFDPSKATTQRQSSHDQPSPPIAAGTPSITQTHKQTVQAEKKPFQWQFLLPKYWGIWLMLGLILPLIYLPLRAQFFLGRYLGIVIYKLAGSRRRDTLINLKLAFPEKPEAERELMAKQVDDLQS